MALASVLGIFPFYLMHSCVSKVVGLSVNLESLDWTATIAIHPIITKQLFTGVDSRSVWRVRPRTDKAPTMASATLPPRFLLPALSPMWRSVAVRAPRRTTAVAVAATNTLRSASTQSGSADGKTPVLEKPIRFNPPSHGARLPRNKGPKHYGGALSDAELRAQSEKHYPGMLPPQGSKTHRFIHSRGIHLFITLVSCVKALPLVSFNGEV